MGKEAEGWPWRRKVSWHRQAPTAGTSSRERGRGFRGKLRNLWPLCDQVKNKSKPVRAALSPALRVAPLALEEERLGCCSTRRSWADAKRAPDFLSLRFSSAPAGPGHCPGPCQEVLVPQHRPQGELRQALDVAQAARAQSAPGLSPAASLDTALGILLQP